MVSSEGVREYVSGSLWVLPGAATLSALALGLAVTQIELPPDSRWAGLQFQGTADDARGLLTAITSTVVTVMAVVLGLTVVALQLASTQFSPRLLRNFLRDRLTQLVLGVFMGTFVYSTAGLYTVGVSEGGRVEEYPRLAVTGAMLLLGLSLAMVVVFADHLAHSIQVDAVTGAVQSNVLRTVEQLDGRFEGEPIQPPPWAVPLLSRHSGYIQVAHPRALVPAAVRGDVCIALTQRVGQHVVAGYPLALAWRRSSEEPPPDVAALERAVNETTRIGFERTLQQDAAFGMRQLVDVACKALSPAINDPYSAVQAIDHLSVIFAALAGRPLGDERAQDAAGVVRAVVPGRRFGDYLPGMCGLIRRYGGAEPTVCVALLNLLEKCAMHIGSDVVRMAAIEKEVSLIVDDARRRIGQPDDFHQVQAAADAVRRAGPPAPRTLAS
jgi:uncharacterized membrane protein